MGKKKLELEFVVKCSPKVLYNRLSTASGLSEWFADNVAVSGKKYTFMWDGSEQEAELTIKKENLIVRFNWIDEEDYFEFRITRDELTSDVSLIITDFADEDDIEETQSLWNTQISTLRNILGS